MFAAETSANTEGKEVKEEKASGVEEQGRQEKEEEEEEVEEDEEEEEEEGVVTTGTKPKLSTEEGLRARRLETIKAKALEITKVLRENFL